MPLIPVPPDDRGFDLEAELASHHAAACGWALACCRWDADQAADVLQTAYLRIVEGSARYGGQSAFRTWLFGVIRRVAAGERRRALLRRMVPLGLPGAAEPEDAARRADLALADDETISQLRAALGALPERQREVLHLVFYQELTIEEAGAVMGVSLGTARTHYERGKAALRRRLGPELRLHA